jgi:hypothetical protein
MSKQRVFAIVLGTVLAVGAMLAISDILRENGWGCTTKHGMTICQ